MEEHTEKQWLTMNKRFFLFAGDVVIITAVFCFSYIFRIVVYEGNSIFIFFSRISTLLPFAILFHVLIFYVFELYELKTRKSHFITLIWIVASVTLATLSISFLFYLFPDYRIGRVIMAIHVPFLIIFIYFWRKWIYAFIEDKRLKKNLIWIDFEGTRIERISEIMETARIDYNWIGCLEGYKEIPGTLTLNKAETFPSLELLIKEKMVDSIILSENPKHASELKKKLIDFKFKGIEIFDYPTFYQKLFGKVPVRDIKGSFFLLSNQDRSFQPVIYLRLKRILDICLSIIGIILAGPLLLFAGLAIKFTSCGPVFFRQERLGINENPFTLIKFRTMCEDAEAGCGPKWSCEDDPRITKIGKFLRKTRIDEIPQLINVLKGEMSFVGPRPIRKHFADKLAREFPFYRLRFSVKPGVTGWAQVNGDYAGSVEGQLNKLEYELFYIQNRSTFMDLLIVLKTVTTVLFKKGE